MRPLHLNDDLHTKKLLRFGTAEPRCSKCGNSDDRFLCCMKATAAILCRNCRAKSKPLSAKAAAQRARRLKEAGYYKPECVICLDSALQILELDHLAGAANSTAVEPLCANHHAIKSFMAESWPMAALRLRDPNRSALLLQAAFELGLGAVLSMFAAWDGMHEETARSVFLGIAAAVLIAWAIWNISADAHFETVLGPGYDRAIAAEVPR